MKLDVVRALKDKWYRESLNSEERILLPTSPVGSIDLTDEDLKAITGGDDVALQDSTCSCCCCTCCCSGC